MGAARAIPYHRGMLRRSFAIAALVVIASIGSACAGGNGEQVDPCKRALERLAEDCGYQVSGLDTVDTHCTGQSACVAACLETSPCDDINHNDGEFADCTAACN